MPWRSTLLRAFRTPSQLRLRRCTSSENRIKSRCLQLYLQVKGLKWDGYTLPLGHWLAVDRWDSPRPCCESLLSLPTVYLHNTDTHTHTHAHSRVHIYIYIYTCMHAYKNSCMCLYIHIYICMYVCMYIYIYVCMHVCMSVCMYTCYPPTVIYLVLSFQDMRGKYELNMHETTMLKLMIKF